MYNSINQNVCSQNVEDVSDSEFIRAIEESNIQEQQFYQNYKNQSFANFKENTSKFNIIEKQTSLQNFFKSTKSNFQPPKKCNTYFKPASKKPYNMINLQTQIQHDQKVKIKIYGKNKQRKKYNYKKEQIPDYYQLKIKHEFCPNLKTQFRMEQTNYWYYIDQDNYRSYQFDITMKGLLQNIIVCLPTGMGKTFIAYNIMYNFYNWFIEGKLFFLAPTKPLVGQQYEKLKNLGVIKDNDIIMLTGKENYEQRKLSYQSKRVFFMTPQTLQNDIIKNKQDIDDIVLIIYDECHKALGNYSYCKINNELQQKGRIFRSVGLTATPGENINTFWEIAGNIMTKSLEIRLKNDSQIWRYTQDTDVYPVLIHENGFQKYVNKNVCKMIKQIQQNLKTILIIDDEKQLMPKQNCTINYKQLIRVQKSYIGNKEQYNLALNYDQRQICFDSFQILKKLLLFKRQICDLDKKGELIFNQIIKYLDSSDNQYCKELLKSELFQDTQNVLKLNKQEQQTPPKMIILIKLVQKYIYFFEKFFAKKIIIFTHTKQSAFSIKNELFKNNVKKCSIFIGQDKKTKTDIQMTQQQQIETLDNFNKGLIDILIATSVAEEGLDISEVNLIICYDSGLNPTRLMQRFGRTGRNKRGQVVLLLNSLEIKQYLASKKKYKQYTEQLVKLSEQQSQKFCQRSPCMIPKCLTSLDLKVCKINDGKKDKKFAQIQNNVSKILDQIEQDYEKNQTKKTKDKKQKNKNTNNIQIDQFFKKKT